jgi:predicted O-methyltransferase YrrM
MAFLVRLAQCRKGIEVGVFTGYSSLAFAEALPDDGKLLAIDVSDEYCNLAIKYWKEAGVDHKIELNLEGGIKALDNLLSKRSELGTYDFSYVDANKTDYPTYFEKLAKLMRVGGFIMFDNVLWSGQVLDEEKRKNDPSAKALYETV